MGRGLPVEEKNMLNTTTWTMRNPVMIDFANVNTRRVDEALYGVLAKEEARDTTLLFEHPRQPNKDP